MKRIIVSNNRLPYISQFSSVLLERQCSKIFMEFTVASLKADTCRLEEVGMKLVQTVQTYIGPRYLASIPTTVHETILSLG